ncbi:MAG: leucine-rich repeat domain-containing protein [Ruminococcus sp.]|nr:leucine-rich repeat domain-containing protein [Ruminococcus sp.]MCM1381215.1 leucine-rich repeat domain-containing protein [Muribaculaceae bacterium]MCM1478428.1 leucine-rich repeat domain-containing protein [Muribaculaceae bacterium]
MKKIAALSIALAMLLSFAACSSEGGSAEGETTTKAAAETVKDETETAAAETTAAPETTTEETTTAEPAPEATPAEDFDYYEEDGEIVITVYKGWDEKVVVPGEIDGKPVVAATTGAFEGKSKITDITLPESLKEIIFSERDRNNSWYKRIFLEDTAWFKAKKEEDPLVIINNIVISGQDCSRDVEIPEGIKGIAACAFHDCTAVTSVTLPSTIEKIGEMAFYNCERLKEITLPDSVNKIGDYVFFNCNALENVTFPNNTVEMGQQIFGRWNNYVPWLENKMNADPFVIVNGNLINGQLCSGNVVIPDTVKSIAAGAFGPSRATEVTLPNGITKIPDYLFYQSTLLTNVTIPDSVTEIGDYAFSECTVKSVTIPNSVTKIGNNAFKYSALTNLTIPSSVTEIGDSIFDGCQSLESVTFSEGLKKLGSTLFSYTKITELTLPDSLESVEEDTFNVSADITYKGEIYFPELYDELVAAING